mmetsp:Transcript_17059/g.44352  ORF Transcript_17059/g.44352 Transcript_17059/m.44352 type:complete len:283 (+) Transcript_17059:312-1160(+)
MTPWLVPRPRCWRPLGCCSPPSPCSRRPPSWRRGSWAWSPPETWAWRHPSPSVPSACARAAPSSCRSSPTAARAPCPPRRPVPLSVAACRRACQQASSPPSRPHHRPPRPPRCPPGSRSLAGRSCGAGRVRERVRRRPHVSTEKKAGYYLLRHPPGTAPHRAPNPAWLDTSPVHTLRSDAMRSSSPELRRSPEPARRSSLPSRLSWEGCARASTSTTCGVSRAPVSLFRVNGDLKKLITRRILPGDCAAASAASRPGKAIMAGWYTWPVRGWRAGRRGAGVR